MITRRTKVQLMIFVLITLLGVSYVGARYARLDRLFYDDTYTVVAHFKDSGGIFADAEVDWNGISVGRVSKLVLTDSGVDAHLDIDNSFDQIPLDSQAIVANRSAIGEQFVDLQPQSEGGPFLTENSEIDRTEYPISTTKLLTDLSATVNSVNRQSLRTTVNEFGLAFDGTGEDLSRVIDTSNSFIRTANDNFDVTTALIRDSNTVLRTQVASEGSLRSFAKNLRLFTGTVAGSDADLRAVIDNGSATANELRTFLEDNRVDLASLINNLVTTGEIVVRHLDGLEQLLVVYPYSVEGGFTVTARDPSTGLVDAHFGLIMTDNPPVCHRGYESTDRRTPQNTENRSMNESAHCAEPASQSNPRGAAHAPNNRVGAAYRAPVVASYDSERGTVTWAGDGQALPALDQGSAFAPRTLGADSWKWLLLQPLTIGKE